MIKFISVIFIFALIGVYADEQLRIGIKKKVPAEECKIQAKKGDTVHVHYRGTLENGEQFDASYDRGQPFTFQLGAGRVIKGWDQGLLNMCEGEHRRLKIPSHLGYGEHGSPPKIPGGATLIFEVEMIKIERPNSDL